MDLLPLTRLSTIDVFGFSWQSVIEISIEIVHIIIIIIIIIIKFFTLGSKDPEG